MHFLNVHTKNFKKLENFFKISFFFSSLIPPFIINNIRFNLINDKKKILLKQSYILLTWFYYLSFINIQLKNKNKLSFFILPVVNNKFTLTKAPMAHKNWSKEQYKFQFYNFKISFKVFLKKENILNKINSAILFVLLTKKSFPSFESNLLFLKSVIFFFNIYDKNYFNYNIFIKNLK